MKCERYWKYLDLTDLQLVEIAKKFSTRGQWRREDNGTYQHVYTKRPDLVELCTAHMTRPGSPFHEGYQVYAYEFSDRAAYVGITCNPKRRHRDHQTRGRVAAKIETGLVPAFKEMASGLMPTAAGELEQQVIDRYRKEGWIVLNRRDGGSTGQIRTKYTYAKLIDLARPFRSRKQFNVAHNGAYQYACNHDLIDRLAAEIGWPDHVGHTWTKDLCLVCLEEAKKFKWLSEWAAAPGGSYSAAHKQGWLAEIKQELFTKKPAVVRWTGAACLARAKDFKARTVWQYQCHDGSYVAARRKGWLKQIAAQLFGPRLNRWSHASI